MCFVIGLSSSPPSLPPSPAAPSSAAASVMHHHQQQQLPFTTYQLLNQFALFRLCCTCVPSSSYLFHLSPIVGYQLVAVPSLSFSFLLFPYWCWRWLCTLELLICFSLVSMPRKFILQQCVRVHQYQQAEIVFVVVLLAVGNSALPFSPLLFLLHWQNLFCLRLRNFHLPCWWSLFASAAHQPLGDEILGSISTAISTLLSPSLFWKKLLPTLAIPFVLFTISFFALHWLRCVVVVLVVDRVLIRARKLPLHFCVCAIFCVFSFLQT